MAIGAGRSQTLRMVVGEALRIVAIGAVAGLMGAFVLGRFIRTLLFEIQPIDVPTYAAALIAVLIIGLLAALVPAFRATRVDPVLALRES